MLLLEQSLSVTAHVKPAIPPPLECYTGSVLYFVYQRFERIHYGDTELFGIGGSVHWVLGRVQASWISFYTFLVT